MAPEAIPLGSAPKPLSAAVGLSFGEDGTAAPAVGVDFSPYYLFGGGPRTLDGYRSSSIGGRLMRVLTKTTLSAGATGPFDGALGPRLGFGLRSTFHDPHDPIAPTELPEEVALAYAEAGVPFPDPDDERTRHRGVDVRSIYAENRRWIRDRSGDAQISGGWGVSVDARGGVVESDSLTDTRHLLWVSAQYTASGRYDFIGSLQYRDAFGDDDRLWIGTAVRRKGDGADLQLGLFYDTANQHVNPGLTLDARLSSNLGLIASVATRADALSYTGPRRIQFGVMTRWFIASDPWP